MKTIISLMLICVIGCSEEKVLEQSRKPDSYAAIRHTLPFELGAEINDSKFPSYEEQFNPSKQYKLFAGVNKLSWINCPTLQMENEGYSIADVRDLIRWGKYYWDKKVIVVGHSQNRDKIFDLKIIPFLRKYPNTLPCLSYVITNSITSLPKNSYYLGVKDN